MIRCLNLLLGLVIEEIETLILWDAALASMVV